MPTTYHRLGNIFYKADQGLIKSVKFSSDYVLIECVESLPEDAIEIKGDEYVEAVLAATKFGFIGTHPIPPES